MKRKLLLWAFLVVNCQLFAQQPNLENQAVGARAAAMGNASVVLQDAWAFYNNVAGLANEDKMSIMGAFELRFGMNEFNTFSLAYTNPIYFGKKQEGVKNKGVVGFGLSRFGDNLFSVQKIGIAYAHTIEKVSLGLKVNYVQVAQQGLNSRGAFVFEFGGRAALNSQFSFAAHIYNFNQGAFRSDFSAPEKIPVTMKAGIGYTPIKPLIVNVEVEKNLQFPTNFKAGVEYQIVNNFFLRTGINTRPYTNHFGMGYKTKKLYFDYALLTNNPLGLVHQLSMQFVIK